MKNIPLVLLSLMTAALFLTTAVQAQPAPAPVAEPAAEAEAAPEEEAPKDPQRVLVTVNGETLTAAQAEAMIAFRAAPSLEAAADMWTSIKLRAAEAARRGLDKDPDNAFILDLFREHFLANQILNKELEKDAPTVSEEEIRKSYDDNPDRYKRQFSATVQHVTVRAADTMRDRELAEEVAVKAKEPDAKFDDLVTQYSKAPDKSRKGVVRGDMKTLEKQLGKEIAEAIKTAQTGDILGPFIGPRGFEVVHVQSVVQEGMRPFEEVKDGIKSQLEYQARGEAMQKFDEDIKAAAEIVESDEIKELKAAAQPPAGPGGPPQQR